MPDLPHDPPPADAPRSFTLRAIVIGSLLAILVNLITPYNDYVVANTFFVGSFLPLALLLTILFFVMIGNGLYRRFLPAQAFRTGELAVILMMLLVSCAIPSQGLLRQLAPSIVTPFFYGQTDPTFWKHFVSAGLPAWLFPVEISDAGKNSEIIRYFYARVPAGEEIPYSAWLRPIFAWGVYLVGFFLTMVSLAYLLRIQWAENERLPFPLAQLQLSLIEEPEPGRAMNRLFRSRSFWIVAVLILIVHSFNALHLYDEKWPAITRSYDLKRVMSEEPWRYVPDTVRASPIYFTFIGATFFIRTRVAFSIWAIYLLTQVYAAGRNWSQNPVASQQLADQHIGSCLAFTLGMIWIGRQFLGSTFKGALGFATHQQRASVWAARGVIVGIAIMLAWMLVSGMSWWLAIISVGMIIVTHVITSRIVAETGMPFVRTNPQVMHLVTSMPVTMVSPRNLYFASMFSLNGALQSRESVLGLTQHGMQLLHQADAMPRRYAKLGALIAWTLIISLIAGWWSTLTCYYTYATPISPHQNWSVLNEDILLGHCKSTLYDPMLQHANGAFTPKPAGYSSMTYAGIAGGIIIALQLLTWGFASWPLLPVGYLMSGTTFIHATWFSILLGWLAKVLVLKLGGTKLLESARPVFIGMIFGEGLAAAIWTLISLLLAVNGYDYFPYAVLPK